MIKSMTGYGRAERTDATGRIRVEAKTLNNRFLDLNLALPPIFARYESDLRKVVESKFSRGRIDIRIEAELAEAEARLAEPDLRFARSLKTALERIAIEIDVPQDLGIQTLCLVPGVIRTTLPEQEVSEADLGRLREVLGGALDRVDEMRRAEGEALRRALQNLLTSVKEKTLAIGYLAPLMKEQAYAKLKERLSQLAADVKFDEARLLQEAAILSERADISEEIERLKSHAVQFDAAMDDGEPAGKKLDFLAQEMNREVNTIAAKARTVEITAITLDMRSDVEKIREQARNVE